MGKNKPQTLVIGLALFSMFFGSGNLIFPLMLGRDAGSLFLISSLGFILSAVLIPTFGVLAITFAEGHYEKIFRSLFSPKISNILIFLVLLSFIPFGAGPRCVVLAHASLKTFLPLPNLWLFSALFLAIVIFLVKDKAHIVDILGKLLTPILLVCISLMVGFALWHGEIDPPLFDAQTLFQKSLFEGYLTQDLLSSLFFSSSLIFLIRSSFATRQDMINTTIKGGIIGITLLAILYVSLMAASSLHSDILVGKSGIDLVSILAKHTLGKHFGLVAALAVALACLTTAVALIMAFTTFINAHFFKNKREDVALIISGWSVYCTSLLEFDGIMAIITPLMSIIYPLIILVVIKYLFDHYRNERSKSIG